MSLDFIKQIVKGKAIAAPVPGLGLVDSGRALITRPDGAQMTYNYTNKTQATIQSDVEIFLAGYKYIRSYGSE